ncbi:MAG TPA: 2-amino-4-hydroxy-6-hydroxymethyldihydropteridine diphosphokinase [Treponemataceae bacterium]|nr:2-amino-4-hydroxy-6-hydroxymethyldihydropteridine diphosphokinase [Treponemataceae bacterium]HPS44372.1 2-amino-4-hydroxy-6-hydroxymethyldihydropteridine diphosphokinase [Treponemataceae bacterium]
MAERVVLSLGANVGDSVATLRDAVSDLGRILGDLRVSSLYVTKPQGGVEQRDFHNIAVSGDFAGTPRALLGEINRIEAAHGRNRAKETLKGPRSLDIDIVLFGSRVVREADLAIPHERMVERQFVLVPLLELHPDSADPVTGERFGALLRMLPDQGVVKAGSLYGN